LLLMLLLLFEIGLMLFLQQNVTTMSDMMNAIPGNFFIIKNFQ